MDPVSSSMLLSEVDPARHAQCSIVTLIVFGSHLKYEDFIDRFITNVILSDPESRFMYRMDHASAEWVRMDEDWSPRDNCRQIDGDHTLESAHALISARLVLPLDVRRPVWDLAFISNHHRRVGDVVSAVVLTLHHSMGDGFTLCHQMMRRSASVDPTLTMHQCYPFHAPTERKRTKSFSERLGIAYKVYKSVVKLILLAPDPASALRNKSPRSMSDEIAVAMAPIRFSVNELKSITKDADALLRLNHAIEGKVSLNDLVVAAVAMALGELLQGDPKRTDVLSAIWVGLNRKSVIERPVDRQDDWGNQNLGVTYLSLPTGCSGDPIDDVLLTTHLRLHEMKNSPEPVVANKLLKLIGSLPFKLLWPLRRILMDKISTSISNFPGPTHPIKFPVAPDGGTNRTELGVGVIKDVYFLVAPPMSFGPYVTIISYSGRMYLSIAVAKNLMPQSMVTELVNDKIPQAFSKLESGIRKRITPPNKEFT